jgi:hypothetical protein
MIELDRESPIEAGGELLGRCRRVELGLAPPVTLVALDGARGTPRGLR